MRPAVLLAAFAASGLAVRGNPDVPLVPALPVYGLSAENVQILVGRSESKVSGDYTFRVIHDPYSSQSEGGFHDYITIVFPVVVPTNGVVVPSDWMTQTDEQRSRLLERLKKEQLDLIEPTMIIEGRHFAFAPLYPFDDEDGAAALKHYLDWTNPPATPPGWKWMFFESLSDVAYSRLRNKVKLHLSYIQPHLPGNISAYLPLLPDKTHGLSHLANEDRTTNLFITFQAQSGIRFKPLDSYNVVGQPSDTNICVHPAHLQLL